MEKTTVHAGEIRMAIKYGKRMKVRVICSSTKFPGYWKVSDVYNGGLLELRDDEFLSLAEGETAVTVPSSASQADILRAAEAVSSPADLPAESSEPASTPAASEPDEPASPASPCPPIEPGGSRDEPSVVLRPEPPQPVPPPHQPAEPEWPLPPDVASGNRSDEP